MSDHGWSVVYAMVEGESMQSVKKNRHTLVDQWWHSSSGGAEQLRVANKWSAGLKPTVFHEAFQVNSEAAGEDVGKGTGGDAKVQEDEDEHRRYGYKDPVIQLLCRSEITTVWRTMRTRMRFLRRTTGGGRRRRRRSINTNIRFSRTMLMSLISWISSTGS